MQLNERICIPASPGIGLVLQYDEDNIYTLENETQGNVITLTREELYDICQIVFARRN